MHSDKKNSTWLAVQFISLSIISVIALKLNIDHFGNQLFGVWIILSSVWGFSSSLDFGFGTTLVKYIAEYRKNNNEKISVLLSSSIFVFVILGIVIMIVGNIIAFLFYFNNSRIISSNIKNEFELIFFILTTSFYLRYLSIFFNSIFEGLSNFVITSKIVILQSLLLFGCVIIITIFDLNLLYLAFSYLVVSFLTLTTLILTFRIKYAIYKIHPKYFERSEIKKIMKFSFSVQLISIFNTAIDPLVKYIIGSFYSVNSVPAYEIARKFAVTISGLYFNAFKIILPKVSALFNYEERNKFISNQLFKYSKFGVLFSGLFFGVLLLPIIIFIIYFFKINEAAIIFLILCLPESINNYGYSIYNFLLGAGKVFFLASLQLINLLVTTAALVIGFKIFHNSLGLIGYFFSVVIGNVLMLIYMKNHWEFNIRKFFVDVKIYKLLILIVFLLINIALIINNSVYIYYYILTLSIFILVIFSNDIIMYTKLILAGLKR